MTRITATAAACVVAVLAFWTVNGKAQDLNPLEKTYLTFSGPVELPGMTLPAGTYTFKLADTPGRNVVQVLSRDEMKIYGQFLFVQARRPEPSADPVVMFRETAEGTTPAVQYWYYPGESIGKEFVYPKDQAQKIAARTHQPVLSTEGDVTTNPQISSIDESGKTTPFESQTQPASVEARAQSAGQNPQPVTTPAPAAQAPAPAPAPAQTTTAVNQNTTPATTQTNRTNADTGAASLPATASPLPLSGLIGLLSVAGGLGLRARRA